MIRPLLNSGTRYVRPSPLNRACPIGGLRKSCIRPNFNISLLILVNLNELGENRPARSVASSPHHALRKRALQGGVDIVVRASNVSCSYNRCIQIRVGECEPQGELERAQAMEEIVQTCLFPTLARAALRQHVVSSLPVARRTAPSIRRSSHTGAQRCQK